VSIVCTIKLKYGKSLSYINSGDLSIHGKNYISTGSIKNPYTVSL